MEVGKHRLNVTLRRVLVGYDVGSLECVLACVIGYVVRSLAFVLDASHCGMIGHNCVALHLYLGLHPTGPTWWVWTFLSAGVFHF